MSETTEPLHIDIVSDVVCPWCIIGWKQLERALAESGLGAVIHWHPFELNPAMPPEGQNMGEHLAQKYGSTAEQSQENRARLTTLGAELGFAFKFHADSRMWNTFNAHQLLDWADEFGQQHPLKQAFFAAHFSAGRNISDPETLADIAADIGLDRAAAIEVLASGSHAGAVRGKQEFWTSQGISGVPAMVFARKYLVTGAQGAEGYGEILQRVTAEAD